MDDIDKRILNAYQDGFPITERPFADLSRDLSIPEEEVIERLGRLTESKAVSRIGAVIQPGRIGASTLAACSVPRDELDIAARLVSDVPQVTHNYARTHRYNLWFVVTASSKQELEETLLGIEAKLGTPVLRLHLKQAFHLNLGFDLSWN